jgi:hypothetical protein
MNGKAAIETERDVLKRIVAMLFSFAFLAERASVRSYPVRCLVLWALRRAEIVARDWLAAGSADDLQSTSQIVLHRNSPAEAMHLAQCFRALAHMLKCEVRLEERLARRLMRGKADHSRTAMPRPVLLTPDPIGRLARTMRVAMRGLLGFEAERLDTS